MRFASLIRRISVLRIEVFRGNSLDDSFVAAAPTLGL